MFAIHPNPQQIVVLVAGNTAAIRLPTPDGIGIWRVGDRKTSVAKAIKVSEESKLTMRVEYLPRFQLINRITY